MKMIRFSGLALLWALGTTMYAQTYRVMTYFNGSTTRNPSRMAE
jgi:hypothetical protein